MSQIATRHNVVPFVSGTSKAFGDQRLAKIGYKSSTDKKTKTEIPPKFPSVCVSVPHVSRWTENQNQRLLPYFREMLQNTQDNVIRSLYETTDGNLSSVSDEDISVEQCIAYMEADATGDRLTKDKIVAWFDVNLRDNLTVVIVEKLGADNVEDVRVIQHLNGYRGLFGKLSKDSGELQETQIRGLRNAIDVCSVDDEIAVRLTSKLDAMLNRPKLAELLELS